MRRSPFFSSGTAVTAKVCSVALTSSWSFLNFDVENHFSAHLAEATQAIGDAHESIFIHCGNIARVIPAIAEHLSGFVGPIQIALHHVGSANQQQSCFTL